MSTKVVSQILGSLREVDASRGRPCFQTFTMQQSHDLDEKMILRLFGAA